MIIGVNFDNKISQLPCSMILQLIDFVNALVNILKELTAKAAIAALAVNTFRVINGFFTIN